MSFQLTINKKPVIFKSGVRMSKKLDKLSTMTFITTNGEEVKNISGAGSSIVNQFITIVSGNEADAETVLSLLSNLLYAMQNEVSQDEIDDYIDAINDEQVLSDVVNKVYQELPKQAKKFDFSSKKNTATTVLPLSMQ